METIQEDYFDIMYEPLAGSSLGNLLQLLVQNSFSISIPYMPRMLYAIALSTIISPFRLKEHIKYDSKIRRTMIEKDPLFVIGHWRSGTTYLHNLLSQDSSYGYCTTFQTILPGVFLGSEQILKPLVTASIPTTRPMDDVPMGPDLPQEEEYALANMTPYGYYNGWCFPKNIDYYNAIVPIETANKKIQNNWLTTYQYFLKKLTFYHKGKQLILKNPANTARIKVLLSLYPKAKFIHIYRNPYDVYSSMQKFISIVLPRYCVQNPPTQERIHQVILQVYRDLYQSYLQQRNLLSADQLIEIPYESFIKEPQQHIKQIYEILQLSTYDTSKEKMNDFITAQKNIRTSSYQLPQRMKDKIWKSWEFAFNAFDYGQ